MTNNDLSPPICDLDRIIEAHEEANQLIERGMDLLSEAVKVAPGWGIQKALSDVSWYSDDPARRYTSKVKQTLVSSTWQQLFDASRLTTVMASSEVKAMKKDMVTNPPEITRESVISTFIGLYKRRDKSFVRGLIDVFSGLNKNYASNKVFKIGKKCILHCALEENGWRSFSDGAEQVNDLNRIMLLLDGKDPGLLDRQSQLDNVILNARRQKEDEVVTDYFIIHLYQNGNIHFTFKHEDLVIKANSLIAKYYGSVLPKDR